VRQRSNYLDRAAAQGREFRCSIGRIDDTSDSFQTRYSSDMLGTGNNELTIKTRINGADEYCYKRSINRSIREIDVYSLAKDKDTPYSVRGTSALPASEIIWHQYQKVAREYNLSSKPSRIKFSTILNSDTIETLNRCFPAQTKETAYEGSKKYDVITGTSLGKIAFRMIKQHHSHAEISSIEIEKRGYEDDFGDITFHVD
jgi:hypothetical protein